MGKREDEKLEVVDAHGAVVGLRRRSEIHGDPSLAHRAVHLFVRNARGDLFLQLRSSRKRIQPGKWDTSVGGHVDPGESYEQAVERELEEELGVRLSELGGELEHLHDYVWRSPVETEYVRTYRITCEGPFEVDTDEIEEGRFWGPEEIRVAIGTGVLTPNLEEELRRLGLRASRGGRTSERAPRSGE